MSGDDLGVAALIVGALTFFLPPLVSLLRGRNAPAWVVGLCFFAVCFVAAAAALFLQDQLLNPPALTNGHEVAKYYLLNLLAVITQARIWYSTFWSTIGAGATATLEKSGPQLGNP